MSNRDRGPGPESQAELHWRELARSLVSRNEQFDRAFMDLKSGRTSLAEAWAAARRPYMDNLYKVLEQAGIPQDWYHEYVENLPEVD